MSHYLYNLTTHEIGITRLTFQICL